MSSFNCLNCGFRIWDKQKGLSKNCIDKYLNDKEWISICGNCKTKVITNYTNFDLRYGLNKPKDQINMIKVKELINRDLENNYWNKRSQIKQSQREGLK